jgi:hypothetical protein
MPPQSRVLTPGRPTSSARKIHVVLVHGLHDLGVHPPYEMVRTAADAVAAGAGAAAGAARWLMTAAIDGAIGLGV